MALLPELACRVAQPLHRVPADVRPGAQSRNLDDDQLRAIGANGGVVQMVAFRSYVKCDPSGASARADAVTAMNQEFGIVVPTGRGGGGTPGAAAGAGRGGAGGAQAAGRVGGAGRGPVAGTPGMACSASAAGGGRGGLAAAAVDSQLAKLSPERRAQYVARQQQLDVKYPVAAGATVKDFVDHIDYGVKLMGIDHVGISSDFDGGGGVDGYNCALESINVTTELVRRGYAEEQINKISSGNLLRVLGNWSRLPNVSRLVRFSLEAGGRHSRLSRHRP